ncbi:hypothetical protein E3P81_04068 [Wallemia ichthyophaga]|nr:hypothetical protein E3P97_04077 [Wallemia ichthyophaga]TIB27781.1 hypothetical protein E3P85_04065 [Wallemia ichthyophaga]TIB43162.1 hypothetical protein E3P82_04076 [Wallemia ichthyophaga]TIB45328.1 hypothetical protein E3P81_04068 [Wallemia ichthyophaga]TIB47167.1 hypothetical protein E3P80_04080 [Wallemia ichthyophaga]
MRWKRRQLAWSSPASEDTADRPQCPLSSPAFLTTIRQQDSMSRFAAQNFNAKVYAEARPSYVPKIYELIRDFHQGGYDAVVDAGCGPGMGTEGLLDMGFRDVYAIDPSEVMLNEGKKTRSRADDIQWIVGSSEVLSQRLPQKVDMVTSFEAAHWMDHAKTWEECFNVLNPGGTVAHVMYGHIQVLGNEKASELILDLAFNKLKAYFKPQHKVAYELMDDISPPAWASRVERHKFLVNPKEDENGCIMKRDTTLAALASHVNSWSPMDQYKEEHPGTTIVSDFMEDMMRAYNAKDVDHPITMAWSMAVLLVSR